jgi:hypothetical protein
MLVKAFQFGSGLKTLDLSLCSQINDDTIISLGQYCSNLKNLDLQVCSDITDKGMFAITQGFFFFLNIFYLKV